MLPLALAVPEREVQAWRFPAGPEGDLAIQERASELRSRLVCLRRTLPPVRGVQAAG